MLFRQFSWSSRTTDFWRNTTRELSSRCTEAWRMIAALFKSLRSGEEGHGLTSRTNDPAVYEYDGVEVTLPQQAMRDLEDLINAMLMTAPFDGGPSGDCCDDACGECILREAVIVTMVHTARLIADGLVETRRTET